MGLIRKWAYIHGQYYVKGYISIKWHYAASNLPGRCHTLSHTLSLSLLWQPGPPKPTEHSLLSSSYRRYHIFSPTGFEKDDENALLQQALAMSVDGPVAIVAMQETDMLEASVDDQDLALGRASCTRGFR